ncbi:MAG: response regulator [Chloroflexi bacterium]|nr:response regulator [Chloroflexota bacterium]
MAYNDAPTTEFVALVEDAYEHLYDLVYLRTHPLTQQLCHAEIPPKDRAWHFHHLLIDAIDGLDPGDQTPPFSREWRRHRLLVLRYIDGAEPAEIASELAIGVRHYYRERKNALQAIAELLWRDRVQPQPRITKPSQGISQDRLELLRMEAARIGQASRYVQLQEVIQGVEQLLEDLARERGVHLLVTMEGNGSCVRVDRIVLRQILLGLLNELIAQPHMREIHVQTTMKGSSIQLVLSGLVAELGRMGRYSPTAEGNESFSILQELAATQGIALRCLERTQGNGYILEFPNTPPRTVLIVDDNEDVLTLFGRYLAHSSYRVVSARTSIEALDLARTLQPFAITLDIMMPDRDGWDTLQLLTNQPETCHIPIIVCTVLAARDLALSLGAAAFLEKPITEQALLSTLEALA